MPNSNTSALRIAARFFGVGKLLAFVLVVSLGTLSWAAEAKKNFNVSEGDAATALKQLAKQAGQQVVFPAQDVKDVTTPAIRGEYSLKEALDLALANTGLGAKFDTITGTFAVSRTELPNVQRAAQTATSDRPSQNNAASGPVVTMDSLEVTGSRLRLNAGEQPMQPVLTFTSQEMERLGVADLGQLFQYIPSVTSSTTGLGMELTTGGTSGGFVGQITARSTANIRGGTETSTLVLVDGKRVAITARKNAGGNGYDLGGIPLSAIDRVEVLLDGASAIYGSDAIYGVINVILKKRYSGTELHLNYDNTFDGDAGIKTVSLTHGFSTGKLSGLVTLSASVNNLMLLTDRRLTATYNRTLLGGTVDSSSSTTVFVQGAGSVNVASGSLPGISPATLRASIPANTAGTTATVADFASAPAPIGGNVPDRQGAMGYVRQKSAYLRFAYDFNERLTVTAIARLGANHSSDNGTYRRMENVTIPAGYPGNPFGAAVRLSKIFYDLPLIYSGITTRNDEYSLGAAGKLAGSWRYDASVSYVRGVNNTDRTYSADGALLDSVITASTVAARIVTASAAGRRPALIYDSRTTTPNAGTNLDEFWVSNAPSVLRDLNENWTYTAQADGTLFALPAGDVRGLVGAERREEYIAFPNSVGGAVWGSIPQRNVNSFFAEAKVPIASAKQHLPLLHQFDLNFAVRTENYTDVGRSTKPRYGAAWRPIKSVLVRGSYGQGFLVPPLYRTASATTSSTLPWSAFGTDGIDPLRGNTIAPVSVTIRGGGNPNLRPQKSEHFGYGIIVDLPKVPGLSVSLDWFDNRYSDNLGGISTVTDRVQYAPWTITRGANLPTDQPGWAGPITAYDGRIINISSARTAGYNFGIRWNKTTAWGNFAFNSSGEKILRDEQRIVPSSPLTASVNKIFRPMRVTSSLFWSHRGWDAGVTGLYGGEYWVNTSNATLAASRFTDSVVRWDLNAGYDFGRHPGFGAKGDFWWKRAFHDTKLRATIINLFNTEPPLDVRGSFSGAVIDPRLRRYVLDFTKRF
jgi:outer membrane receptor protein involved in Fe transport